MQYFGRAPSPPLDQFIERIWYCADKPTHTRERVLPGGNVDLGINLAEDEIRIYDPTDPESVRTYPGAIVLGTSTRSFMVDPRQRASVIGVHFRPGAALPFFGISPSEIVDDRVSLGDLWGADGRNFRERLLDARSASERFRLVETTLLSRLRRARPGHPAARVALAAFRAQSDPSVAEIATMVGLSHRGFIDVFKREVGLTPKLYARLQRFHRVKERIAALGGPPSWAAFALACGYFDQSHMIRDFVEFSGMSPTSYLRCRIDETMFDHVVHAYPRDQVSASAGASVVHDQRG
jgi:AraC-like DNA-binding protein